MTIAMMNSRTGSASPNRMSDSMVALPSAGHAAVMHPQDREDDRRHPKQNEKNFEHEIVFHRAPLFKL